MKLDGNISCSWMSFGVCLYRGFQLKGVITLQVQNSAKTPLKKFMLKMAISSKFNEVKRGIIRRNSLWDKLIFAKIQVG